jgi:hypothetical protein
MLLLPVTGTTGLRQVDGLGRRRVLGPPRVLAPLAVPGPRGPTRRTARAPTAESSDVIAMPIARLTIAATCLSASTHQAPVQSLPFHVAHSVTTFESDIYRIVHTQSVRRGRLRLV